MGRGPTGRSLKPDSRGLTISQAKFVEAFIHSNNVASASIAAGYSGPAGGYQALRSSAVQAALKEARDRIIKTDLAQEAMGGLRDLLGKSTPPGTRFQAIKFVLEYAGHKPEQAAGKDKTLAEMTPDELLDFIAKQDRIIEGGELVSEPDSAPESSVSLPGLPAPASEDSASQP